ncbi:hypothetical protein Misp01_57820 [Microtetraspora sp. NBRC 13810]|uniref:TIGR02611 family protein n=1 Tax=Microtetraspora sp. NBRC 13810 TaxID=3030990 RepID=UPI0024A30F7E|nr:TIGR02611 family protein [Microtetraspora sp. NBRC 13810]GLW10654.1 hypothetical protein Misp01_57820 [Microtetraspora sp. NBRC 13810]
MAISDEVRQSRAGHAGLAASEPADVRGPQGAPLRGPSGEDLHGRRAAGGADRPKGGARRRGLRGWRDGIRSTRTGALTLKIAVGAIGALLVIGGLILVPFPGPGWLIVFFGFAVLATEFHWAHKVLEFGKRTLASWTDWLKRQHLLVRILVLAVTAVVAAAIVYFALRLSVGIDLVVQARQFLAR